MDEGATSLGPERGGGGLWGEEVRWKVNSYGGRGRGSLNRRRRGGAGSRGMGGGWISLQHSGGGRGWGWEGGEGVGGEGFVLRALPPSMSGGPSGAGSSSRREAHSVAQAPLKEAPWSSPASSPTLGVFPIIMEALSYFKRIEGHVDVPPRFEVPSEAPWPEDLRGFQLGKKVGSSESLDEEECTHFFLPVLRPLTALDEGVGSEGGSRVMKLKQSVNSRVGVFFSHWVDRGVLWQGFYLSFDDFWAMTVGKKE